ncbi:DUF2281 domain-containing protein [Phormidesmis priestleyi ULC007]|uniref:DUF2281 domain-containing protein n=1 Tax=Phormidesmis priestleyi ULC007 TaxID=1920490 RepID=A0A2T1DL32_9CYAN|nr:DUF2281 domain-containing protein [Phormidesmis priestleyi]PSB21210.1 DUF2281 domain-containing protein [Phormidesmis priestleyi ULC007]PZO51262.1 MAG: DUF2281 domain-containing protein [Phormidesmis priestleyi]
MPQIEEQVLEHLRTLPSKQQQEVLNFVLFLSQQRQNSLTPVTPPRSFAVAAQHYIGSLDGGPSDLSTNPQYMEGFGE